MDFKPKPGSFTPYLEYAERDKDRQQPALSPLSLLEILSAQVNMVLSMAALQSLSGMDPGRYREALKSLRDAGYVAIEGPSLEEMVKLTDQGYAVARLARPA